MFKFPSIQKIIPLILFALMLCGCPSAKPTDTSSQGTQHPTPSAGLFENIAAKAGITFKHDAGHTGNFPFVETTAGGCAFLDFDQDGKLDIFLVQSGTCPGAKATAPRPHCVLYRNESTPETVQFKDVSERAGLKQDLGFAQGVAVADFDNNGFPDIYITGYGGNHLLRNTGKGKFENITQSAGVGDTDKGARWASSAAWGDYDLDGKLDLYVCHYCLWTPQTDIACSNRAGQRSYCQPTQYKPDVNRLYRNLGGGKFQDVTQQAKLDTVRGRSLGVVWLDYNDDDKQDIYVANDLNANLLWENQGNGTFKEVGLEQGVALGGEGQPLSGMGIAVGDYDSDGREDLYVTNFSGHTNSLYQNSASGLFTLTTQNAGLAAPTIHWLAWGVAFFDLDRDGLPDILLGNGHVNPDIDQMAMGVTYAEPKGLFRNRGDGTFEDISAQMGDGTTPRVTRGLAIGDVDNDGLPDALASNHNDAPELFRNVGKTANHFATIRLVGTKSNRDGIGAKVTVTAGGKSRTQVCRTNSSYLSSCDPRLHFGLGENTKIDAITIRWTGGATQKLTALANGSPLPSDSFLTITEGKGATR
jgi:enediyne biosynthesis protein E4